MTPTAAGPDRAKQGDVVAQSEGHAGAHVALPLDEVVPAAMLDGGEVVHFALKPSPWFIPLVSLRWLVCGVLLALSARSDWLSQYAWYLHRAAFWVCAIRLALAVLQWVSRQYVLTNRRFMRIRGVFRVELFECPLTRIQDTELTLSPLERLCRIGSIRVETAGTDGAAAWRMVARPLEVLDKLRKAIDRAQHRGSNEYL